MKTQDYSVNRPVEDDGSFEFRPERAGKLRRLAVIRTEGDKPGFVNDALFSLAVSRCGVVIGLVENAHVQGFPLRLTVMWDAGDVITIQFNPAVVGKGAQAILLVALYDDERQT